MQNAIEVRQLRKRYPGGWFGSAPVHALNEVTFDVKAGSIFGLLGPNGAGKTTLIKILLGLVTRTGGSATLLNYPAGDLRGRTQVGYLPEHHRIPRHLTGNTALTYYGGLSGLSPFEVARRREHLLEQVGLKGWGRTAVGKYSKGMLQRLGLAQAMLHDPPLLILDEPTDGVDPVGRTEMRAILQQLKSEGKTIFLNSHLLQEIELVCDRVAIMVKGKLCREGTVAEITSNDNASAQFVVRGNEQTIRDAVANIPTFDWRVEAGNVVRFKLAGSDQALLNAGIDRLRASQIDVLSVQASRDSLEDAFLKLVAQSAAPESAVS